ncbi:glycosyltransferase 61 family protein [Pseudoroseicyclus sp. CXY001]|uniref:glycosyltransferase 61 family protein n=1 Tax=Pseudoroseicyclus sp. CXY001 TaxID=3242492 RepID=UPI00357149F2
MKGDPGGGLPDLVGLALADPCSWEAINAKAALNERLGPRRAGALLAARAGARAGVGDPGRAFDAARELRLFAGAGPVAVAGALLPGRALGLADLGEGRIFGRSALIEAGGRVLAEHQGDELRRLPIRPHVDPLVTGDGPGGFHWMLPGEDALALPEALALTGPFAPGWGHALLEFAPQLLLAEALGLPRQVPAIIDAGLPEAHLALFRWLAPGRRLVPLGAGRAARVGRLWRASAPDYWPVLRQPEVLRDLRHCSMNLPALARLLALVPPAAATGERLYLARPRHPRLAEPEAVAGWFAARGFAVLRPETLSFAEQARRVRGAAMVAGAAGSQMLLAQLFGRAGQRCLLLHHPVLEETPALTAVQAALGQRVRVVTGRPAGPPAPLPYNQPLTFAEDDLAAALEALDG